jgi:hypothetical protein
MTTPDHDESKPRRRWPTYVVAALVLLLIAYPLSLGPAAVIICRHGTNDSLVKVYVTIYWPLGYAAESLGTDDLLNRYGLWWLWVTNTPIPNP